MASVPETDREGRLDEVLAEYLKAVQTGSAPSRQELLERHPDLAADLAEFFADRDRFDRMATPLRGVVPPRPERLCDFGDYEVLEEIARGGMGVVYKARQKSLRRVVALKMLLAGRFASRDDLQRFRTEAEAVASLDHPHIVPIFEVGSHEGRPYLCMKFLGGGSLAQCFGRSGEPSRTSGAARLAAPTNSVAAPKEIARRVIVIADAVHYAHQRGILHRDLKPANILLDEQGQPHVSDFGLAKRQPAPSPSPLPPEGREGNKEPPLPRGEEGNKEPPLPRGGEGRVRGQETLPAPLTHTGALVGTPAYMAPEQASGKPGGVTVAADVYGLGAILYELLTGRPPFKGESPLETIRLVLEREPERPSALRPGLDRDLETICLKCLQKEPERRYASAADLADDLRRFVEGRPIQARPVGAPGRLRRWVRRQPVVAGLTGALAVALVTGLVLVTWLWRRAEANFHDSEKHRLLAEANYQKSEEHRLLAEHNLAESDQNFRLAHQAVKEFCLRVSDQLGQVPGTQRLRKALLDSGVSYLRDFLKRRGGDPRLKVELADTWRRVGDLTRNVGRKADAVEAYRQAIALYAEIQRAAPGELKYQRTLAALYRNLPPQLGRLDEALAAAEETRRVYERFLRDHPGDRELISGLAGALNDLSARLSVQGDGNRAMALCREAADILERLLERDPRDRGVKGELTATLNNLAVYQPHDAAGRAEALRLLTRTNDLNKELTAEDGNSAHSRANLASSYYNLSAALMGMGRVEESRDVFKECLKLREEIVKEEPDVTRYQSELAYTLLQLGRQQQGEGPVEEATKTALATFRRSYEINERLHLIEPGNLSYRHDMAMALFNAGSLQRRRRNWADAEKSLGKARELMTEVVRQNGENGNDRYDYGRILNHLALSVANQGRPDDARPLLAESLTHVRFAYSRAPSVDNYRRALDATLDSVAQIERNNGHPEKAVAATLERQRLWAGNARELYRAGRDLAAAAGAVDNPQTKMTPREKTKAKEEYAGLAIKALREAVEAGYRDLKSLQEDGFLKSVRGRPEFEELVERVRQAQPNP